MAFIQFKFDQVTFQSRDIFNTYIYETDDTISDVLTTGYFNACRFADSEDWVGSIIQCKCSDGLYILEVDSTGGAAKKPNNLSSGEPCAAGLLMRRLAINATDLHVLVISDSTGNEQSEWVYLLSEWYAENYPLYSVDYRLWDDGAGDYAAAVSISTGTGANSLTIYNFANSGKNIDYGLGSKFANSVALLPNCELIIINHGHNMYAASGDSYTDNIRVPRFISGIGQTIQAHPDAGLIIIAQNPVQDNDDQQRIVEAANKAAALLNADISNTYDRFIDLDKALYLYAEGDNVHPSAAGTQLFLNPIVALHKNNAIPKMTISNYDHQLKNILVNGDFSAFAGATPDNWTSVGTITKETGTFIGSNGYSVGIEGSGSYIRYAIPTLTQPSVRGKWITLSVLMYIESGAGVNSGRISIATPLDPSTSSTQLEAGVSQGGWKWVSVTAKIRDTSGYIWIKINGDTGGAVFVDRACLVQGKLPTNAF